MKKKQIVKSGRNRTNWIPDSRQRKIVELLVNPDDKRTKTQKIEEAGVQKSTFYEWMKNENFLNYLNSQIDKYTSAEVPEAWKALVRKVKMGDTQAIKLFFELKNMSPDLQNRRWYQEQQIALEYKKLAIIENKNGNGANVIEEANSKIATLADLINNPIEDRNIEDYEHEE